MKNDYDIVKDGQIASEQPIIPLVNKNQSNEISVNLSALNMFIEPINLPPAFTLQDCFVGLYSQVRTLVRLVSTMNERIEGKPKETPEEKYLNVDQVAKRWGMCSMTIRRYMARKKLPCYPFGRAIRIRLSDVQAFEEQQIARYQKKRSD